MCMRIREPINADLHPLRMRMSVVFFRLPKTTITLVVHLAFMHAAMT